MTNVLVLGSMGMLGRYVDSYLRKNPQFNVTGYSREDFDAVRESVVELALHRFDVVINCIGVIKQVADNVQHTDIIQVNSIFPNKLATYAQQTNTKVIHITTDCVYSGALGFYTELDPHDALDVYGKTKSLGESPLAMNIRTSIIGEELDTSRSLIEWVKSNNNKKINGYTNHTWNGVTCLELAKFIERTITEQSFWTGTRHVFNTTPTSKKELVELIVKHFKLNIQVTPVETPTSVHRTLSTIHSKEITTSIDEQLAKLAQYTL